MEKVIEFLKGIPSGTWIKLKDVGSKIIGLISQNFFEQGDNKLRVETTRIGQWMGLIGYGFTMILIGWIVIMLVKTDGKAFTSEQLTDYIALAATLGGLGGLFSLFYLMKKKK